MIALLFTVFLTGPFWLTYLLYRKIIHALSSDAKPASLFAIAFGLGYVLLGITVAAVIGMMYLSLAGGGDESARTLALICFMTLLLSCPLGVIMFLALVINRQVRMREYRTYLRLHPDPKYQIWLQDILVATFALGVSLIVLINWFRYLPNSSTNVGLIVYEVLTEFVMFFAVLDVCRLSTRLNQNARDRALFIFALMLIGGIFPMPIFTALAWNVWRRAMFLSAIARQSGVAAAEIKADLSGRTDDDPAVQ